MKLSKKWLVIIGAIIAVGLFAAFGLNRKATTQYFTQAATKGDIREVVEATGTINAVTSVQVGSQVSGTIDKLNADFNSRVKKGQIIAQLDQSLIRGALLQAQADLENAVANAAAAKANLEKAKATLAQAKSDYDRTKALADQGVMSQQQLDVAKANYESAVASVNAGQASITQANAQVSQRRAAVSVQQTNLDHTIIRAPVDGTVIARNIDVGQTVAASLQAPTLFTIAQDLAKMLVYTKTDESDVGMIRPDQRVTFKVDAFPKDQFMGHVQQVRMNATTVQNVVTYDTIIAFDNPDLKLFPGMTAYVTIPVATARDALRVPNGALRYKPDMPADQVQALYKKFGIETGGGRGGQQQRAGGNGGQGRGQGASGGPAGGQGGGQRAGGQGGGGGRLGGGQGGETPGGGAASMREQRQDTAIIWKRLPDKSLEPVQVRIGITDHTVTEVVQVLKGTLNDGDDLIVGASTASSGTRAPGMGGPGGFGGGGGRPPGR